MKASRADLSRVLIGCGVLVSVAVGARVRAAPDTTAWQLLDDGDPSPAVNVGTYDVTRQRPVLVDNGLGGAVGPVIQWELVGEDWQRRRFPEPTPHRFQGCVAYDTARGRLVMFGEGVDKDRTWEFDGTMWVERVFAVHPPGRAYCSMTFDAGNSRIVMFGGYSIGFSGLGDTWEYDGTSWQQISGTGPAPRGEAGIAFDSGRGVTVLVGGRSGNFLFGDVWEYDAARDRWRDRTTASGPSVRAGPGLAYDPIRARTVLFGGLAALAILNDTWEWDGRAWQQQTPTASPSPRFDMITMFDAARGKVLGWGGRVDNSEYNDTWTYDGTTWTRIAVSGLPEVRGRFALAYSPELDAVVMYGGRAYTGSRLQDTWYFANGTWTQRSPPSPASAQADFHLEHNPATGKLEGFGGVDATGWPNAADDHSHDPVTETWTSTPACCPEPRMEHGWTYADSLGGMLMFGGDVCCVSTILYYANDTWLKTPSGWLEYTPAHVPPARTAASLAWDGSRGRAVAYGGYDDVKTMSDTWEFDGVDWVERSATSPPGPRESAGLIYDPVRHVAVLFGAGSTVEAVTWEYDGTSWLAKPTPTLPDPSRARLQLAYDPKREVVFLFGGKDVTSQYFFNDTWVYGADPDEDGIVGKLDNCATVANADQANADADAAGDLCDCAPSDPGAWSTPQPVSGVFVSGTGTTTLTWADQSAIVGPGVRYDVGTGDLIALQSSGSYAGATCLVNQTAAPSANDARLITPGNGYWYLVRARNVCGLGTYGAPALDGASPCP